jgi:hypothetical protein
MGVDIRVTQRGRNLSSLSRDLKETGQRGLRKELLRGVRTAARSAIPDIEAAAAADLPKRGGLAADVAGQKWSARSSMAGPVASVRIVGQGMRELKDIDQGVVRHPVFGNRDVWKRQTAGITPGFFSGTLQKKAPEVRRQIDQVMRDVKLKIERDA